MTPFSLIEPTTLVPGLTYIPKFITLEQEGALMAKIDAQPWSLELKRRVQHYGYAYDYKSRRIDPKHYLGDLPNWLDFFCRKLWNQGLFQTCPDQVIINEYLPGQGISPHIDCIPCFEDTIASLSLGTASVMDFLHPTKGQASQLLEPKSLLILQHEARYTWKHGIAARKRDVLQGIWFERGRRVSLTFRKVAQTGLKR
jgi:alkylated DNA repair dioxygenase AlkB